LLQAEVEHLRESLDSAQHELQHMRRQRLQAASSSGTLPAAVQQQQQQQQPAAAAAGGERAALQLHCSGETAAVVINIVSDGTSTADGPSSSSSSNGLQASTALSDALAGLVQAAGAGSSSSAATAADPQLMQQAAAALAQLARAQGLQLPVLLSASSSAAAVCGGETELSAKCGGEAGGDASSNWQQQCVSLQLQVNRLQSELAQAEQDAAFSRDAAERRAQVLVLGVSVCESVCECVSDWTGWRVRKRGQQQRKALCFAP
jgi:FtsZ-binding cell division protein ZapB